MVGRNGVDESHPDGVPCAHQSEPDTLLALSDVLRAVETISFGKWES
jgi:hypothetical protein